ncbi:MAG: transposase [Candidatus Aminicenantes bacterium]|nr:transposase [Candidatus Aminicenantes bacterium]
MAPKEFFISPQNTIQKQYEALRAFYAEGCSAEEAARRFGYKITSFYSLTRDFKNNLSLKSPARFFFISRKAGRKPQDVTGEINRLIISLRKKYLSVPDIKAVLNVQGYQVSEKYVYNVIKKDGFARLPRRSLSSREKATSTFKLEAPKTVMLDYSPETFSAQNALGILCLLPYIQNYGIDRIIEDADYPETNSITRVPSIMSFVALKLSNVRRYSEDDAWCMDRGLGLFAGLNVLPKTAWYTSYSSRVRREMNRSFLKNLHQVYLQHGLLSDTSNLDFTTIPYWGDSTHLENNWSGKRNKALASMLAVLAQDPDSGIITYGDTNIRHNNKSDVVIEFLDFYKNDTDELKYLVFDSKFTTYQNLGKLNQKGIKFLTIRRRGKNIVEELNKKPASVWKKIRVPMADGKGRILRVIDENVSLRDYGDKIRQISITGHGKIKPALIITNDFNRPLSEMIRKYTRRWIVEKGISEQIEFFHLNRVSSSMVIKVDFDLTMSILAHNLIRLFAMDLPGYSHSADFTLFNKFLSMSGSVEIKSDEILVKMKKKRNLPALLTVMEPFQRKTISILGNRKLILTGDTTS